MAKRIKMDSFFIVKEFILSAKIGNKTKTVFFWHKNIQNKKNNHTFAAKYEKLYKS
jgi:hypothetical protein